MFRNQGTRQVSLAMLLCASASWAEPSAPQGQGAEHQGAEHQGAEHQGAESADVAAPSRAAAPEQSVTLPELLEHAMQHAPDIVTSRAGIAAGRAELDASRPWLPNDPVISGKIGRRWTAAGSGIDYAIGVAQELDVSGRRGTALAAAQSNVRAHQAELHAAEWLVHQRVHAGYHQALVARERLKAAGQMLGFSEHLAHIARERFAAGDTSPLPARLAAGEVAQAKQAAMLAALGVPA